MVGEAGVLLWAMLDASPRNLGRNRGRWPIDRASLATLRDLGLSNFQIGSYLGVSAGEVRMLCEHYDLFRTSAK